MNPETTNAGSGVQKSRPGTTPGQSSEGTGDSEAHGRSEAIARGRQIAVSMMDRAEAKYRHEHGQPHLREHCESCAEEYWADRLRPVHYREAAISLRRLDYHQAALLLEHVADDEEAGR